MSVSEADLKRMMREVLAENQPREAQESHIDHVCECPDCLCGVMDKLNKESEYVCRDCGFPLGNEKMLRSLDSCPNCHAKNTARRKKFSEK